ncbi:MAG: tripartite tricarboxylate transporter TctB family protein [Paracoccaceae bacterium]
MSDGETGAQRGVRADFWFGFGLTALGLVVTFESWRMPRLAELNVNPMTAPGLVPGMVGIVLTVLGAVLCARAARAGGWRMPNRASRDHGTDGDLARQTGRFFVALALSVGYAAGLVGSLPFWAATGIFVFLFVVIFEWRGTRSLASLVRAVFMAALLAVIVATAVTYVFEQVFLVRLP